MSKVEAALVEVGEEARNAFLAHLKGGTSATWLSEWMTKAGHPMGATTIKDFRRRLKDGSK